MEICSLAGNFKLNIYLEQCDGLCVQSPVVPLPHGSLIGVVDKPSLLEDLGADPLGLLHGLDQTLDRDVRLDGRVLGVGLWKQKFFLLQITRC